MQCGIQRSGTEAEMVYALDVSSDWRIAGLSRATSVAGDFRAHANSDN